jgi:hypothetical protein
MRLAFSFTFCESIKRIDAYQCVPKTRWYIWRNNLLWTPRLRSIAGEHGGPFDLAPVSDPLGRVHVVRSSTATDNKFP